MPTDHRAFPSAHLRLFRQIVGQNSKSDENKIKMNVTV